MQNVRGSEPSPGEFRTSQNWLGRPGCTLETATFVPPPPQELLAALGDLEKFLHDPAPMPALVKVGLAHAQFETIHPFLDGNGRVGRLLITFLLCEQEILKRPLLYLSYYFKKNRLEYYDRLQAVRDHGDWEGWLKYFLRGILEVS
jgi:Fic family protein